MCLATWPASYRLIGAPPETKKPLELRATCHMLRLMLDFTHFSAWQKMDEGQEIQHLKVIPTFPFKKICLNPLLPSIIPIWARYIFSPSKREFSLAGRERQSFGIRPKGIEVWCGPEIFGHIFTEKQQSPPDLKTVVGAACSPTKLISTRAGAAWIIC